MSALDEHWMSSSHDLAAAAVPCTAPLGSVASPFLLPCFNFIKYAKIYQKQNGYYIYIARGLIFENCESVPSLQASCFALSITCPVHISK